jgi:uncharacterized protein (TIGR02118 family)
MIRLIALYRHPSDEIAFLHHYDRVHTPLVQAIPHLRELRVSRVSQTMIGEPGYFLMAEMMFDDQANFAQAMASRENRAAGADVANFAAGLVTVMVAEDR